MAQVFYDKTTVQVEYDGVSETLLASNCTINYNNSLQPLYVLGNKGSLGHVPAGPRVGDISFDFLTSITGEVHGYPGNIINYLASGIKHSIGSTASGALVKCAGISGWGFLNSYAFNAQSNAISTSSASFGFFGGFDNPAGFTLPLSGRITGSDVEAGSSTSTVATGVAHGRYTTLSSLYTTITDTANAAQEVGELFAADYSISFAHNPIYKLGQETPLLTLYANASESINAVEDVYNSGLSYTGNETDYPLILESVDLNAASDMRVTMVSGVQVGASVSVGLDDIARSQKTLTAAY
jgi:hypothetical protein